MITLSPGDVARLKRALAGNAAFSFGGGIAPSGGTSGSGLVVFSAGASSAGLSAVTFSNANNVSFGLAAGVITAAANTGAGGLTNVKFSGGTQSDLRSDITFSNANNVSFGLSNGVLTAIANTVGGGAITNILFSAGTYSTYRSDITFDNSNGVSFGQDTAGVITATVATNYQSQGAYLTTAALSQDSSKYAGTTAAMTGGSVTLDTAGIAINLPAYLTTAQPPGAYLTTAALSQDSSKYAGTSTGMAGGSVTLDTAGISISLPAYLTTAQPPGAYLTTAALSQDGSKYAGTSTGMTGGSVTLNTSGIAISLPAYLTTAMQSNAATISNIKVSAGTLSNNLSAVTFSDGSGVSWGLDTNSVITASVKTDYQTSGAYLTTAALSQDSSKYAGTSTGMTGGSVTLNTSGIAISLPAYLTTAQPAGNYAGTNTSVVTTAGTDLSMALNTSGLTVAYAKWITTYVNDLTSQRAGTNTSVQTTAGTDLSCALNTSGLTIAYPAWLTTAAATNITSARAGTNTSVVTTSGTDVTFAVNTSGVTIAYPKYITTYAAQSSQSAIEGVGVSNTGNTAGNVGYSTGIDYCLAGSGLLTLSQSTAAGAATCYIQHPAWLTTAAQTNVTSDRAGTNTSVVTTAGTDISFAVNTSGVTIAYPKYITTYVNDLTSDRAGTNTSVVTTAGTDVSFAVNTSGVTIAYPKYLTTAAVAPSTASYWSNMDYVQGTSSFTLQSNSVNVQPFCLPYPLSVSYMRVPVSFANLTSTTVALTSGSRSFYYYQSINAVLYSQGAGASSRSIQYVASSYAAFTEAVLFSISNAGTNESIAYQITYPAEGNNTANVGTTMLTTAGGASIFLHTTGVMTNFTGIHWLDIPLATLLNPGCYWVAFNRSTATTTSGGGIAITNNLNRAHSFIAVTQINSNFVPLGFASSGAATASTQPVWQIGLGSHSVSAQGATTSSLALSSISSVANFPIIPMQLIRQA